MEFERENDIMDQRQEMMDDAIDDAMGVDDEAEGDEVVEQVLEEIGVDLRQAVSLSRTKIWRRLRANINRWARRRKVYRPMLFQRAKSHKLLEVVVVIQVMTIFKLDLIASDDEIAIVLKKYCIGLLSHCFVEANFSSTPFLHNALRCQS
jgi:hypothetical protein